jgi:O-antigen/teichoic acid export membrane protein
MVVLGMYLSKKLEHTIWITITAAAINIGLNYLLTPKIGAIGASFSIMIANFAIFILTFRISQRFYFIPFDYKKVLVLALPAAVIISAVYYFDLRITPRIILSFLYFIFTAIFIYKSFKNTEDFKKLIKFVSRIRQKKAAEPDTADINL